MNRNYPYTESERRRLADEIAGESPTNGGGRTKATASSIVAGQPPAKRSKPDPSMTVTSDELQCAQEIKRVVESNTDTRIPLDPELWSDYEYAQHAITITADLTNDESTKSLLRQMYKLQSFKKEYNIKDTVEEGVRLIQKLMQMMPGYLLSIDYAPRYGSYIAVFDYAAFRPELLRMHEDLRVFLGASYYIFQCLSTTLKAVRSGAVFITECQGMQNENFDQQLEEKYIHHLFGHYPFKHKECLWLNCPTIANIAYGLLKSQMPPGFLATWRLGCKLDGYEGRIDGLFKVPTLALAQEQLLVRIQGFLTQRGQHAGGFELHQRMVYNPPPPPPQPANQRPRPAAQRPAAQRPVAQRPAAAAAAMRGGRPHVASPQIRAPQAQRQASWQQAGGVAAGRPVRSPQIRAQQAMVGRQPSAVNSPAVADRQ